MSQIKEKIFQHFNFKRNFLENKKLFQKIDDDDDDDDEEMFLWYGWATKGV